MNLSLHHTLHIFFHSCDVGNHSQALAADFLVIDLHDEVDYDIDDLIFDVFVLKTGKENLFVVEKDIG